MFSVSLLQRQRKHVLFCIVYKDLFNFIKNIFCLRKDLKKSCSVITCLQFHQPQSVDEEDVTYSFHLCLCSEEEAQLGNWVKNLFFFIMQQTEYFCSQMVRRDFKDPGNTFRIKLSAVKRPSGSFHRLTVYLCSVYFWKIRCLLL